MIVSLVPYKIFPAKTGGEKGIALFTEHLAEKINLICVTVKSNDPSAVAAYKVCNILSDSRLRYINLFYFFRLKKFLRNHQATHLLIEHPYYGWLGVLLKWFTPVKLIIHSHNIESQRWKNLGKWWWRILFYYEKWTHRQADYNLFISDEDKRYAIEHFGLSMQKCITATFGIALKKAPDKDELLQASTIIRERHGIAANEYIFIFNGIYSYKPNADALDMLVNKINPLLSESGLMYKLIICGRDIPKKISNNTDTNIIIAGFVDDIMLYLKGADIFLNPITDGGGIKTKLVEALANNLSCVSFASGAIGIPNDVTGNKLHIAADGDFKGFCQQVQQAIPSIQEQIPSTFFAHFNWDEITRKVATFINS